MDNATLQDMDNDKKDDLWFQQIANNAYKNHPYMNHYNKRVGKACVKLTANLNNELPQNKHSKIDVVKMRIRLKQKLEERKQNK